jgi:phosphatidate cytidylyltransferase
MERSDGELAKRVGVAVVGIPVTVFAAYMGGYWLAVLIAAFAGVAAFELCMMYLSRGVPSDPWLAGILAAAFVLIAVDVPIDHYIVAISILSLAAAAIVMLRTPPESDPGLKVVVTIFASLYTGILLAFAIWLRGLDDAAPGWRGTAIVFMPVAITWLGDSAAYFVGKAVGRHKLSPRTSPNKTWEGAIAALAATAASAVLYAELTGPVVGWTLSVGAILALGAVVSIVGQVGDLFESRFKRDCGVKDSSQLLPGHGGALDRVDSLLFAFPFAFAFFIAVGL